MKYRLFSLFRPFFVVLFCISLPLSNALAVDTINVGITIGDGSNGRVFRKWSQVPQNLPINRVEISLQKTAGGGDAYVNLRFGDGQTFENGKRVSLGDNSTKVVSWSVGGETPNNRPLVLNAYKSEVRVNWVKVYYADSGHQVTQIQTQVNAQGNNSGSGGYDEGMLERCRNNTRIKRPRIDIGDVRPSGGMFSGKYRIEGSVRGICVEEAGYFEGGRLKKAFNFPLSDNYRREEFSVQVRGGKRGEIRITSVNGQEDSIMVDDELPSANN